MVELLRDLVQFGPVAIGRLKMLRPQEHTFVPENPQIAHRERGLPFSTRMAAARAIIAARSTSGLSRQWNAFGTLEYAAVAIENSRTSGFPARALAIGAWQALRS